MTAKPSARNVLISIFVVVWLLVFHYQSICYFYLDPLFKRPLPKMKFLFPPAGWIMFYNVNDSFGHITIYGIKGQGVDAIDPHDVFRTRTIGFDNIHRGILGEVADIRRSADFCGFLKRRFPYYDNFVVTSIYYPSLIEEPNKKVNNVHYQCEGR